MRVGPPDRLGTAGDGRRRQCRACGRNEQLRRPVRRLRLRRQRPQPGLHGRRPDRLQLAGAGRALGAGRRSRCGRHFIRRHEHLLCDLRIEHCLDVPGAATVGRHPDRACRLRHERVRRVAKHRADRAAAVSIRHLDLRQGRRGLRQRQDLHGDQQRSGGACRPKHHLQQRQRDILGLDRGARN